MPQTKRTSSGRISRTLLLSILAMGVNYLISLVLTGYITENMGADAYGFVSLAKTISNYAIIFTSTLNAYASRYITVAHHKKDTEKASTYYSSVFYANVALSLLMMLIATVGVLFVDKLLNVPDHLLTAVRLLLLLDFANYMLLATGTCFTVYAYISDKLDLLNTVKLVSYLAEALILFLLFFCFKPSIAYVGIGLLVSSIVFVAANLIASKKYAASLNLRLALFRLKAVKELVVSGIWNSFIHLGNLLQSGLDLIISNLMLSAIAMGQVSVVKTLTTIFDTLYQLLSAPFHPRLLKQYSENDTNGVISTLKTNMKISGFVSTLVFAGFVVFGKMYYQLWTPTQNTFILYALTIITFLGSVTQGIVYPLFYTYTLTVKNKVPCIGTIISGVLNLFGMFFLIKYLHWGVYAVVLTTTVLGWGTYLVFTPIYSAMCLGCSKKTFYPTILRILLAGAIMTACLYPITLLPLKTSWAFLLLGAICATVVCAPIYFFCALNKGERRRIIKATPLRKFLKSI